ncbi:hypothetical protein, partial [Mesorhizobium sp. M1A.T.Ca.IN.004.03.1.1]|uniref:hypothetical protein n=1 Tax=Mesorhizobium sp. M1A.T.Ca.IN.004.03.1.1 TaxID=2496795 RepID=UPI0019D16955
KPDASEKGTGTKKNRNPLCFLLPSEVQTPQSVVTHEDTSGDVVIIVPKTCVQTIVSVDSDAEQAGTESSGKKFLVTKL